MIFVSLTLFTMALVLSVIAYKMEKKGEAEIEKKILKETIDDIRTAKLAKEAVDADPALRNRLHHRHDPR